MKRTTIFIDESVEADLHALARRQQRPVAAVVREAVAQYVVAERQAASQSRLGFVGIGRSGASDTAERQDEIVFKGLTPHGAGEQGAYPTPHRRAHSRKRG